MRGTPGLIPALATENAELRLQLAAQNMMIETAIDAGDLHARIRALQVELARMRAERDARRAEADRPSRAAQRTG